MKTPFMVQYSIGRNRNIFSLGIGTYLYHLIAQQESIFCQWIHMNKPFNYTETEYYSPTSFLL